MIDQSLRGFIANLEEHGELRRIKRSFNLPN